MLDPKVNLSQSLFQDTYFVVAAEMTAYRQLRAIELQMHELDQSIQAANLHIARLQIRITEIDESLTSTEMDNVDRTENANAIKIQERLLTDARSRLDNFYKMKLQVLGGSSQEYWDAGFEAAEGEYWVAKLSRQIAIERLTQGTVGPQTLNQIAALPNDMAIQVISASRDAHNQLTRTLTSDTKLLQEDIGC